MVRGQIIFGDRLLTALNAALASPPPKNRAAWKTFNKICDAASDEDMTRVLTSTVIARLHETLQSGDLDTVHCGIRALGAIALTADAACKDIIWTEATLTLLRNAANTRCDAILSKAALDAAEAAQQKHRKRGGGGGLLVLSSGAWNSDLNFFCDFFWLVSNLAAIRCVVPRLLAHSVFGDAPALLARARLYNAKRGKKNSGDNGGDKDAGDDGDEGNGNCADTSDQYDSDAEHDNDDDATVMRSAHPGLRCVNELVFAVSNALEVDPYGNDPYQSNDTDDNDDDNNDNDDHGDDTGD